MNVLRFTWFVLLGFYIGHVNKDYMHQSMWLLVLETLVIAGGASLYWTKALREYSEQK